MTEIYMTFQRMMRILDGIRPAPVQRDDPALLKALAMTAANLGPFYAEKPHEFEVRLLGKMKEANDVYSATPGLSA